MAPGSNLQLGTQHKIMKDLTALLHLTQVIMSTLHTTTTHTMTCCTIQWNPEHPAAQAEVAAAQQAAGGSGSGGSTGTGATETFTFNLQSLADLDGDGLPNELPSDYDAAEGPTPGLVADTDDDADGLEDVVETDTGVYIDSSNTGTDPLDPDTDDDGICDGPNAVPPICIAGPDPDPNGDSEPPTLVALNNTEGTSCTLHRIIRWNLRDNAGPSAISDNGSKHRCNQWNSNSNIG